MKYPLLILLTIFTISRSLVAMDCQATNSKIVQIDSILAAQMQKHHLPGAVIAIVSKEGVCQLKGYGMADQEKRIPVSPHTLFGLSSLSKTFTAAAILDLVQTGKLSLDQDVEEFFPVRVAGEIQNTRITVSTCLTHTSGLDERTIGISARTPDDLIPLQRFLSEQLPPRVRPANQVSSYSNHGYALLGGVIEKITRRHFPEVLQHRIFHPAGMNHSSFEQPLPAKLEQMRAIAYNGRVPVKRIYFNDFPASGMFTTASDMAIFLTKLFAEKKSESTDFVGIWRLMQEQNFTNHPSLPGLTYGFSERVYKGIRILQQGGDWQDYSSFLAILPESQFGLFLAFNSPDGVPAAEEVLKTFIENSVGQNKSSETFTQAKDISFEGSYRYNRYSRETIAKIGLLVGAIREISVTREGNELMAFRSRWFPASNDLLFRREPDNTLIGFRRQEQRITHLFHQSDPYSAYEKIPWIQSVAFYRVLILVLVLISVAALIVLSVQRKKEAAERWLRISIAANLTYVCLIAGVLSSIDPWEFQYGVPTVVIIIMISSYALPILSVVASFYATQRVFANKQSLRSRISFIILTMVLAAFLYFLYEWRLLGLQG